MAEPISTALAVSLLVKGVNDVMKSEFLGNIGDAAIGEPVGAVSTHFAGKTLKSFISRLPTVLSSPENHDLLRAVRKSYLNAALVLCFARLKILNPSKWRNCVLQILPDTKDEDVFFNRLEKQFLGDDATIHAEVQWLFRACKEFKQKLKDVQNWQPDATFEAATKSVDLLLKPEAAQTEIDRLRDLLQKRLISDLAKTALYEKWNPNSTADEPADSTERHKQCLPPALLEMILDGWRESSENPNQTTGKSLLGLSGETTGFKWFDVMCAFFAEEIKRDVAVRSIMQTQLLVDLKYQRDDGREADLTVDVFKDELAKASLAITNRLATIETEIRTLSAGQTEIKSKLDTLLPLFVSVEDAVSIVKILPALIVSFEGRITNVVKTEFEYADAAAERRHQESQKAIKRLERAAEYSVKQNAKQAREGNLKPIPNELPSAHDVFDRKDECAKLFDLLTAEGTRLVRILAPSGYGKTKLVAKFLQQTARQIKQEAGQSPIEGILYVECQAGASIVWGQIVERAGLMFGKREELRDEISKIQSPPQQAAYLLDELEAAGRFWLVFDNFESLLDAENATVGADESDPIRNLFHLVCSEAVNQRLVVTTRREPVFKGKNAPLLQNRFLLEVGGTPETDAINYLRAEGKDYLLDQIDETIMRDFVRRVDCLPLAVISLLRDLKSYFDGKPAGKVTLDDVAAIVAAGTRYVEADKENGLRLWLTEQIKQLHPDEKDLLRALSVFNKPCPAIALEFVLPDFSADKIEKLLARLERDRLLYQEGDGFQLSVIIRDAAYSLIPAEGGDYGR